MVGTAAGMQARTRPSLTEEASRMIGRLSEVKVRLEHLHDNLFGSEPRDASLSGRNDAPVPNVTAYHINTGHSIIEEVENLLARIEAKL